MNLVPSICLTVCMALLVPATLCAKEVQDAVCGPRCVYFLLTHYQLSAPDLTDLIVEMQGTVSAGSTFGDIKKALESRGIHTRFVSCNGFDLPCWPDPVVVHLDGEHFAVLTSSNGVYATLWNGLAGSQHVSGIQMWQRMSKDVLLISKSPISENPNATSGKLGYAIVITAIFAVVLGVWLLRRAFSVVLKRPGMTARSETAIANPKELVS